MVQDDKREDQDAHGSAKEGRELDMVGESGNQASSSVAPDALSVSETEPGAPSGCREAMHERDAALLQEMIRRRCAHDKQLGSTASES